MKETDCDDSDDSSLSYEPSSSSSSGSEADLPISSPGVLTRRQIEDTIERLHMLTRIVQYTGAKHRRERMERYLMGQGPSQGHTLFKAVALQLARHRFGMATDTILERIADSFARRRIRFQYLQETQQRPASSAGGPSAGSSPTAHRGGQDNTLCTHESTREAEPNTATTTPAPALNSGAEDQEMVYSATENTRLQSLPAQQHQGKAESVASVVLRHSGFPRPPKVARVGDDSFRCPYCCLDFSLREAEPDRWRYVLPAKCREPRC